MEYYFKSVGGCVCFNRFLKVGSQNKPPASSESSSGKGVRRSGSWRHAIFKRVVSPSTPDAGRATPVNYTPSTPVSSRSGYYRPKRTRKELRELWQSAINQQIILIRMEKQNLRLKGRLRRERMCKEFFFCGNVKEITCC